MRTLVEVKLHDIGEGMTEGEILQYFVNVGDRVQDDQPLVEVQTDKMTAELPSPASGVVKEIVIHTGENVSVGTTLLIIERDDIQGSEVQKNEHEKKEQKEKPQAKAQQFAALPSKGNIILAAPYTRKIARELGVNLEEITGTGPAGRIMDEDVHRHLNKEKGSSIPEKVEHTPKAIEDDVIPFKGRRKQIAAKMAKSLYTIPHVTHFEEADVTNLLQLTANLKKEGESISVAAFFIKAVQLSLKDFPVFNAVLDEENEVIRMKRHYNIGIAVEAEEGLIVPVIRNVEHKSVKAIHAEMKELIKKAQDNKLTRKDMTDSTFTISNVGPLGSIAATPIINYPETGLMAFHKAKKRPAVVNDEIVIRSMMNISMSFDHRVADGARAVAYTNRFVQLIENPARMLLELM